MGRKRGTAEFDGSVTGKGGILFEKSLFGENVVRRFGDGSA